MMQARRAAGSRLKTRSTSSLTIRRTASSVRTTPPLVLVSTDIIPTSLGLRPSPRGAEDGEDAVIRTGHAAALGLGDEPGAGQPRPLQRRLVRALPEVTRLGLPAAAEGG